MPPASKIQTIYWCGNNYLAEINIKYKQSLNDTKELLQEGLIIIEPLYKSNRNQCKDVYILIQKNIKELSKINGIKGVGIKGIKGVYH